MVLKFNLTLQERVINESHICAVQAINLTACAYAIKSTHTASCLPRYVWIDIEKGSFVDT